MTTIDIPLYLFLFVYLALLFVSLIYVLFNFYHLFRFGSLDVESVFASFLFLAVLVVIVFASYQEIVKINWRQSIFSLQIPDEIIESIESLLRGIDVLRLPINIENFNLINRGQ